MNVKYLHHESTHREDHAKDVHVLRNGVFGIVDLFFGLWSSMPKNKKIIFTKITHLLSLLLLLTSFPLFGTKIR